MSPREEAAEADDGVPALLSESSELASTEDASLEALLKRAAHVSGAKRSLPALSREGALAGGRLRIVRRIGEGGMGVVYEAHDQRRGRTVALKTLGRLEPSGVYRLKNEFRSLSELSHANVCHLYELFGEGLDWFFTMELVHGEPFLAWVRPHGVLDLDRLRSALAQLCDALSAIHGAGKLHRDLKPSNVLVEGSGRVVVLDFGLAVDPEPGGVGQTLSAERVSGTPAYMAPEQAAGAAATAASDAYAVGVMLFEALSGRLPFAGRVGEILAAKQRDTAPGVNELCPDAPLDLAELCDGLLARQAERRADLSAWRREFGQVALPTVPRASSIRALGPKREQLLGRESELERLRAAFKEAERGRAGVLFVSGRSGMGKSALVRCFLDELASRGDAVVLAGRCYERESVPFKAFDSVVDELSRYLRRLSREDAGDLMPRDVFALARLFPVLERVEAVAQAPKREISDLQELQQRAFAALGELFGRIRDRHPLLLYVDDLQWTDRDSTALMDCLLASGDPSPLLLVLSHRSEGADDNPLLRQAREAAQKNPRIACDTLDVGQLSSPAALALAEQLLGEQAGSERAHAIVKEAQGSPFFVGELARQVSTSDASLGALTLREAVLLRVRALEAAPRALLTVLAVAGRPLAEELALEAVNATCDAAELLVAERLARVSFIAAERVLECYHDKVRESVTEALAEVELREVHRSLAGVLSFRTEVDPELLALHYHGAGELELAATFYERAGDVSSAALAFEYAARQYGSALALGDPAPESQRSLRLKLGAALAADGRCREAAHVYRAAAVGASASDALEYTRTAAHLLMTSGYVDEGRVLLGEVLNAIGLALPRSRRQAMASALWSRARLKLRGLTPTRRGQAVASQQSARLGALWTVVQGSVGNDPFLMVEMAARYARLALDSGTRGHAARALAMEAYLVSFDGANTAARTETLLGEATALATTLSEPEVLGFVQQCHGGVLGNQGRFAASRQLHVGALEWLLNRCTAVAYELSCVRCYDQVAAHHLGQFAHVATSTPSVVEDALRRGDMWCATILATAYAVPAWLAHGGLDEALTRFGEAKRRYVQQSSYQWLDFFLLQTELSIALYQRRPARALALAQEQWSALSAAQLLRLHMASANLVYCRAGCALALARSAIASNEAERALIQAAVSSLHHNRVPHARGFAASLEAGLSLCQGRAEAAAAQLAAAVTYFDATGLALYAAAARRRLGQLIAGQAGSALVATGDAALARERVLDVEAITEMLCPGLGV
ncbi:MAG: AAA family ATPase [Polyangiaceae bacterium]